MTVNWNSLVKGMSRIMVNLENNRKIEKYLKYCSFVFVCVCVFFSLCFAWNVLVTTISLLSKWLDRFSIASNQHNQHFFLLLQDLFLENKCYTQIRKLNCEVCTEVATSVLPPTQQTKIFLNLGFLCKMVCCDSYPNNKAKQINSTKQDSWNTAG